VVEGAEVGAFDGLGGGALRPAAGDDEALGGAGEGFHAGEHRRSAGADALERRAVQRAR
jgi:hypothetical protein